MIIASGIKPIIRPQEIIEKKNPGPAFIPKDISQLTTLLNTDGWFEKLLMLYENDGETY